MKYNKGFSLLILLAIIAVLAVAGGGVYLAIKQKGQVDLKPETNSQQLPTDNLETSQKEIPQSNTEVKVDTSITTKTNPAVQVNNTVVLGSKETFIKFRTKFDSAKTFDEALAVSIEYATQDRATFFRNQSAQVTEDMKTQLFPSLKSMIPPISSVTIVNENIVGNTATLSLKNNNDAKTTGTVTLKKESGVWKIEGEAWK